MVGLARSQFYYRQVKDDSEAITAVQQLANDHPVYGFRKLYACLRRSGRNWNHKKVYRIYKLLKLNKKRKGKRRLPQRTKQPLLQQTLPNTSWSMDFMSDSLMCGSKFRTLNLIDDYNRQALSIEIGVSLGSSRVIRLLEQAIEAHGQPAAIRVDNGPEFTSQQLQWWCQERQIALQYIQPGRPMQNGFIERFNGSYRREVLDSYAFFDLNQVRQETDRWITEYNTIRPHEALNNMTPLEFKQQFENQNVT
jgi:putative transposase